MDSLFEGENNYYYQITDSYHNEADVGVWNSTICSSDSSTKEIDSNIQNSYEPKPLINDFKYSYCSHRPIPKEIQYSSNEITLGNNGFPRVVKKRNTANKKERRRTQSINTAFSSLRNKIPNVPVDTKLSKIKTLRLATSYILYLTRVLEGNQDPSNGFQAELITSLKLGKAEKKQLAKANHEFAIEQEMKCKKNSGRTGWPQDVWASELKQEGRQLS